MYNNDSQLIIKRIEFFIKEKDISISEFSRICGLSNSFFTMAKKRNSYIGIEKLLIIVSNFPDFNINWAITGEGEMITKEETISIRISNKIKGNHNVTGDNNKSEHEKEINHLKELLAEKEKRIILLERLLDKQ